MQGPKTKLESFKAELLGRVQLNLKKQNKIIYSQSDPTIGPPTFQSPLKKGGNHKGGALNKGPYLKRGRVDRIVIIEKV